MRWVARLRYVQGIVGGISAFVLAVAGSDYADNFWWSESRPAFFLAAGGLAVSAVIVPVIDGIRASLKNRGQVLRSRILEILHTNYPLVVDAAGFDDFRTLGMHVFIVQRTPSHPIQKEHVRVARIRMASVGIDYELDWVRGKGVIGACWRDRQDKGLNYESWVKTYAGFTKEEWERLDEQDRWGLTYDDFQRTKTSFGAIVATPIFDPGRKGEYLGAVAADGPPGTFRGLAKNEVGEKLQACAQVIGSYLALLSD